MKKLIALVLAILMVAAIAVACTQAAPVESEPAAPETEEPTAPETEEPEESEQPQEMTAAQMRAEIESRGGFAPKKATKAQLAELLESL